MNQLFRSISYFVSVFFVFYPFEVFYGSLFKWYTPFTLLQTLQLAIIITTTITYGDLRERETIREIASKKEKET